jgi:hypothetical protein
VHQLNRIKVHQLNRIKVHQLNKLEVRLCRMQPKKSEHAPLSGGNQMLKMDILSGLPWGSICQGFEYVLKDRLTVVNAELTYGPFLFLSTYTSPQVFDLISSSILLIQILYLHRITLRPVRFRNESGLGCVKWHPEGPARSP